MFRLPILKYLFIICVSAAAFTVQANAESREADQKLKEAVALSNENKNADAISMLKELAQKFSDDRRILVSLGFVYQKENRLDDAIETFEKALLLKQDRKVCYSLGFLYEAKAANSPSPEDKKAFLNKALSAWEKVLELPSKKTVSGETEKTDNSRKSEVAAKHIEKIKSFLDSPSAQ